MKTHQSEFETKAMCEALGISRACFYQARRRPVGARKRRDLELRRCIKRIHEQSRRTYGSPRVLDALRQEGECCGRKRVARLMSEDGLRGVQRGRRKVRTTQSDHDHHASPNRIKGLQVEGPDCVWVSDITYLPLSGEGSEREWAYLAVVMDLWSRKIVGWALGSSLEASLVMDALKRALMQRQASEGLIVHSDRGVQYACKAYRCLLAQHGIDQSMSAKGNCYDNATMESFFGTLKAEGKGQFPTARQARLEVFDYIEAFYNRNRIHTSLKGLSPQQFEDEFSSGMGCSSGGREKDREPAERKAADSHDQKSHHPGYPLEGCSPAEPSAVSPEQENQACNLGSINKQN